MHFSLLNFSNSEIEHIPIDELSWNIDFLKKIASSWNIDFFKKIANISSVEEEENGNLVNYADHAEFGLYNRFTASLFLHVFPHMLGPHICWIVSYLQL